VQRTLFGTQEAVESSSRHRCTIMEEKSNWARVGPECYLVQIRRSRSKSQQEYLGAFPTYEEANECREFALPHVYSCKIQDVGCLGVGILKDWFVADHQEACNNLWFAIENGIPADTKIDKSGPMARKLVESVVRFGFRLLGPLHDVHCKDDNVIELEFDDAHTLEQEVELIWEE